MRGLTCLLLILAFVGATCLAPGPLGPEPAEPPPGQETVDTVAAVDVGGAEPPTTMEPAPTAVPVPTAVPAVALAMETKPLPTAAPTRSPSTGQVRILMYHYIRGNVPAGDQLGRNLSVSPADFDEQVRFLADHEYVSVSLDDVVAFRTRGKPLPVKAVLLTFDDGYQDFFTAARPILRRYKFQATTYVITGKVGTPGYMSWSQLTRVVEDGSTVGSHTINHLDLRVLNDRTLERELRESKQQIESHLGIGVDDFCYPSGMVDQRVRAATAAAGYQTATTVKYGIAGPADDLLALPRVRITGGISLRQFAALIGESFVNPPTAAQSGGR